MSIKSQINLPIIFLDCTGYPLGLLGPLAGRLVDDLSKPVFCYANKDNVYKFLTVVRLATEKEITLHGS